MPEPWRIRRIASSLGALLLLPLAACRSERGGAAATFTERDSAEIRIVESTAPQWGEGDGWTLSAEPVVDIGVVDGAPEYQLSRVADARLLKSGRIAVADGGSQEIRVYDGAGRHLRTVGRKGSGPGEFQMLIWIRALPADSLLVYDAGPRRVSTFDSTGAVVGSTTLAFEGQTGYPRPVDRYSDGTFLVESGQTYTAGEVQSGMSRDSAHLFRVSAGGSRLNAITDLRGMEAFIRVTATGMSVYSSIFGHSSAYALSGDRLFAADNDRYEIGVYTPAGRLVQLIRRRWEPRSVTAGEIEEFKRRQLTGVDNAEMKKRYAGVLEAMPRPATMPSFGTLRADDAGDLWVQQYPGADPDASTKWTVFDPEGRMLGDLSMPGRFRPKQIGSDFVLGIWKDDLDVEHVRMYRLEKQKARES